MIIQELEKHQIFNMEEIHLTKKDFKVEWFSGTGAGGQHRNKHPNCCRITHIETGISSNGTESKSRETNKRKAFERLTKKLIQELIPENKIDLSQDLVRTYNKYRDEVKDKASKLKQSYKKVVEKNNLSDMINSRRESIIKEN